MIKPRRVAAIALFLVVVPSTRATAQDTTRFDEVAALARLRAEIAGKEDLPAVDVFKNIQQYKGATAGRLLRIMELGFSRSLGVTCTHCHDVNQWDADVKTTKEIAREMSMMVEYINSERLKKIPGLRSANPSVNCTTCHRGQLRPALALPPAPATPPTPATPATPANPSAPARPPVRPSTHRQGAQSHLNTR